MIAVACHGKKEMTLQDFERVSKSYDDQEPRLNRRKLELPSELSNPEAFMDFSLNMCRNLNGLWLSSDFQHKVLLQKLVFPDRITINRETSELRTPRVNKCIILILSESKSYDDENNGPTIEQPVLPGGAERVGFEPTVQLPAQRFSRPSRSATLAPLLIRILVDKVQGMICFNEIFRNPPKLRT